MSNIQSNFYPKYPDQPHFKKNCPVNFTYQTLDNSNPFQPNVSWKETLTAPTTIKNLYTGVPNYYPLQRHAEPVDTVYGKDFSQFIVPGVQNPPVVDQKTLQTLKLDGVRKGYSYGWFPYPFTDREMNETVPFSDKVLPYMSYRRWMKIPVVADSSLNTFFQVPDPVFPAYKDWTL